MRLFILALLIGIAAQAQPVSPKDTVGPDHFWFTQADFFVAKDRTSVATWVDFYPGNSGWFGNVTCETSDGTAVAPVDYETTIDRLYFSYTQHPLAVNIPIHTDTNSPEEKIFYASLSDPTGYPTGKIDFPGGATIHLLQNTNGNVSFAQTSQYVLARNGLAHIRVIRTGDPNGTVTVHYNTNPSRYDGYTYDAGLGGTAVPGTHFMSTNGTLTFGPGETEHSFDVTILSSTATNYVWRNLYLTEDYGPNFHIVNKQMELVIVPQPALSVQPHANGIQISWPYHGLDFTLERASDAGFSQPIPVSYSTNTNQCVAIEQVSGAAFYRLKQ